MIIFRTKWKRQTAVGIELLAEAGNMAALQQVDFESLFMIMIMKMMIMIMKMMVMMIIIMMNFSDLQKPWLPLASAPLLPPLLSPGDY